MPYQIKIEKKINNKVKCISYPNGKQNILNRDLTDLGIDVAYTKYRRSVLTVYKKG